MKGSSLDRFEDDIRAMLAENREVAAAVILEQLRSLGYGGGITLLKERVARLGTEIVAARSFQRTRYLQGEIGRLDW